HLTIWRKSKNTSSPATPAAARYRQSISVVGGTCPSIMSRIIPPPSPVATDNTSTPNRSIFFRTASIPPVKPNAKVPTRFSISVSSIFLTSLGGHPDTQEYHISWTVVL